MTDTRGWIPIADASKPLADDSGDFGLEVWGYRHPDDHQPILSDVPATQEPPQQTTDEHFESLDASIQDRAVDQQLGMTNLTVRSTGEPSRPPMSEEELEQTIGAANERAASESGQTGSTGAES